ncbi:MAG: EamA family transporter [Alphaproteobacteria bacterium]|nr:EamA family transporter [Alphaproteobacteria bacterium]
MSAVVIGLVLTAAALHAAWNALLRSGGDGMWTITVMSLATCIAALPIALLLPWPARACWPYLSLATLLHTGYSLFLVRAYRDGEFGLVYPLARGSAPLLVTLGAAILAGERPGATALLGIVLVSLGILSLARGKAAANRGATANAFATGLFIAAYTVNDGLGSRLSGNPLAYSATLFLLYGVLMTLIFLAIRGPIAGMVSRDGLKALAGGALSLVAYGLVIWAVTLGPMGSVSALRETSVVFAALIGRLFLREVLTARRFLASAAICLGAVCLALPG